MILKNGTLLFVSLIGIMGFLSSCNQEEKEKSHEIYIRRYAYKNDIPEQGEEPVKCWIDTVEYVVGKPLGEYYYSSEYKVFSDSILKLWNQISMRNIKKFDPELLQDGNYERYQFFEIGDNYRLAFWRMINKFYSSCYNFDEGFYVVEIENRDPYYSAYYLISSKLKNKYLSYRFEFGVWNDCELISYLTDINKIDINTFYYYYSELKKQKVHDEFLWGPSELTISYFHNDTIESYVNIDYGNIEITNKMKDLLNGN
jgi:hypothetical protein